MTDLVVMSLEAWDGVWRRNQHLISRMLDADPALRVLFVEPPADPVHDVRARRRPHLGFGPRLLGDVSPRLWTMRPTKALPRRVDRRADERIANAVQQAATRLDMTEPLLWINDPAAADVRRRSGWPALYDMTDDWAVAARSDRERTRILAGEQDLLENAAAVVACSPELLRRKSAERAAAKAPIVLIRNAVDTAAYAADQERPADLPAGRIALYAGTLHADRLDTDVCVRTAEALAGSATVVFVGPDALDAADSRRLTDARAVVLGARPHEQIPAYLRHADVLLVPHRVDEFTDSLDPIKLYEYQAAGRPVVSTAVAGFREADDPRITIADAVAFPEAVAAQLGAGASGRPAAAVVDWADRAAEMAAVVATLRG
ncbi:hypothetical protein LK09_03310 [Microbacterium mangrovi]|uniref:Glycosyltransferase n=1 Tax=Microbacterium mangrovi TaxID=1348253 RepID=A0A0B2ACN3_9MICO|nr:glycosyltransferase [Microbacterium mangrovi]KHK99317.1 hypothetical protein LK09_03310 [Microbacterium mangrovi]